MVLSGIFVKLGWIGLLTYGYRTSIPLLVCCYSALYGVTMLSLSMLSIFHIKRYLAIMTCIHTNIFLGFMFLSCGSLECMGLSYQHSVASRGLLLIAGYRADHCTSKRLLIIRGRLLPWLYGILLFYCAICGPFTIAAKCEFMLCSLTNVTQLRWTVLVIVMLLIPKTISTWIAAMYVVWSLHPNTLRSPHGCSSAGSDALGLLLYSCFSLYWCAYNGCDEAHGIGPYYAR